MALENKIQKVIIGKIKDFINFKNLEPGDKLPSERFLSDKFDVSRSNIRDAIQKLEFYRILKSVPQSGTFITEIGVVAMNGIIDDILRLEQPNIKSLLETRFFLEIKTVELAALKRTDEDIKQIEKAFNDYKEKIVNKEDSAQEGLLFHLAIAKASGNEVINDLILTIIPDIVINIDKYYKFNINYSFNSIKEYEAIFFAIKNRKSQEAKLKMSDYFNTLQQKTIE